jgi:hypothetical protein
MNAGAKITGNGIVSGLNAGGVSVSSGTFTMNGGEISGNAGSSGAGVYVSAGTFTMNGGVISGNTAGQGGGVYVGNSTGTFTMNGGVISGNTATSGGGVYQIGGAVFITNGTIYGSDAAEPLKNTADPTRGAAFYINSISGASSDSVKYGTEGNWTNLFQSATLYTNDTIKVANGVLQE